jgi:protein-S-isoprenylcysteine O-methyltransferase Ste14
MNIALPRVWTHRLQSVEAARPGVARRSPGDLASKVLIVALFSAMAMSIASHVARTGRVTGLLMLASEALVVALTIFRRPAGTVDRTLKARLLTVFATFGPPLVRPWQTAVAPESVTVAMASVGLFIVVVGKLSLGRSFGLAPANRGVVSTGLYALVRHPIYLGYLITHTAFVLANLAAWNLAILATADTALMVRARLEERTLAKDAAYREYMTRVRWRLIPGVV